MQRCCLTLFVDEVEALAQVLIVLSDVEVCNFVGEDSNFHKDYCLASEGQRKWCFSCWSSGGCSIHLEDAGELVWPSSIVCVELLLDYFENSLVGGLDLPIGLRVGRRGIVIFDFPFLAPFSECSTVKLLHVVSYDNTRHTKPAYHRAPKELLNSLFCDGNQLLSFDPLSEVVNGDNHEFYPALSLGEGPNYIDSPLSKRPWHGNWGELLRLLVGNVGIFLGRQHFLTNSVESSFIVGQ